MTKKWILSVAIAVMLSACGGNNQSGGQGGGGTIISNGGDDIKLDVTLGKYDEFNRLWWQVHTDAIQISRLPGCANNVAPSVEMLMEGCADLFIKTKYGHSKLHIVFEHLVPYYYSKRLEAEFLDRTPDATIPLWWARAHAYLDIDENDPAIAVRLLREFLVEPVGATGPVEKLGAPAIRKTVEPIVEPVLPEISDDSESKDKTDQSTSKCDEHKECSVSDESKKVSEDKESQKSNEEKKQKELSK